MIIISQDKDEIINFDNVMNINILDCKEEGYLISAGFIVGRDDNYRELGYYKTEERAKEILQDIVDAYSKIGIVINTYNGSQVQKLPVYEMPED